MPSVLFLFHRCIHCLGEFFVQGFGHSEASVEFRLGSAFRVRVTNTVSGEFDYASGQGSVCAKRYAHGPLHLEQRPAHERHHEAADDRLDDLHPADLPRRGVGHELRADARTALALRLCRGVGRDACGRRGGLLHLPRQAVALACRPFRSRPGSEGVADGQVEAESILET